MDCSKFVIGVSSRALFDLEEENRIFTENGLGAYKDYQSQKEDEILEPGPSFQLVKKILKLNTKTGGKTNIEVIIMSQNDTSTAQRIINSIKEYQLNIKQTLLTGGAPITPYLKALNVNLFLSANEQDVKNAIESGSAAGLVYNKRNNQDKCEDEVLRIAFDGDCVLFDSESDEVFRKGGIGLFTKYEQDNVDRILNEGPFAKVLKYIEYVRSNLEDKTLIRTALVTARSNFTNERVLRTLKDWGISIDESAFLDGNNKCPILEAFRADIFFDDNEKNCETASEKVPTARVLEKSK